jgi:hypothetical protein
MGIGYVNMTPGPPVLTAGAWPAAADQQVRRLVLLRL